MNVRVMDYPAISTEDAVRRSLLLFRETGAGGEGDERRVVCWPGNGRSIWVMETPGLSRPLCGNLVEPLDSVSLDYHFAETSGSEDRPVDQDFKPVLLRWVV